MPANVLTTRDAMESTRLLLPSEAKLKKGKWSGRIIKRLFRRDSSKTQTKSKYHQQHPILISGSDGGEESVANQYFTTLKESSVTSGIEELDLTTVNLSYSGGSNPYSTDDSYDYDNRASWRRKKPVKQQPSSATSSSVANNGKKYRSSDVSLNSDPTATSTTNRNSGSHSNAENSFVQLDVPKMQKASPLNNYRTGTPAQRHAAADFDDTSFQSETGTYDSYDAMPFVYHTRSSTSRVLENTCPTMGSPAIVSDHGMEVVLFDSSDDAIDLDLAKRDGDDDIFMSFKLSTLDNDDEWRDPFKDEGMKIVFPETARTRQSSGLKEIKTRTPERKFSFEYQHGNNDVNFGVPPSPAVSLRSETSVTWVSHDDDDADDRPMKEIHVPKADINDGMDENSTFPYADDMFLDQDSINEVAVENIILESLLTPNSSNNSIFASTPVVDEKQTDSSPFAAAAVSFPFFWNSPNNVTSIRSAFTPQSAPAIVTTQEQQQRQQYRLSPRRAHSSADPTKEAVSNFHQSFEVNGKELISLSPPLASHLINQKKLSSAFLKRKSVFMGEDLLTQEAESFAEFLEDHEQLGVVSDIPHTFPVTATPILDAGSSPNLVSKNTSRLKRVSAAERLLFAMSESIDNSETDNHADRDANDEAALVAGTISEVEVSAVTTVSPIPVSPQNGTDGTETPISESVDLSYAGNATLQSMTTSRTGSTGIISKSLSDEDADDEEEEELTNNASASYASSCTSYAPSTLQGSYRSRFSGINYTRSRGSNNVGTSQLPYCGVFVHDDVGENDEEEEEDEEDDLSLPSEDFSVHRRSRMNIRHYISSSSSSRHGNSRRKNGGDSMDGTPLLDQVRNELLETVQDLAREGSTVVMNFLRPRP